MKKCIIIGISDSREQWFPPRVMEAVRSGSVFSGGKRHREIVESILPDNATWIDIAVPLSGVFEQYAHYESVVIFASGDPLFYGFANTVQRECPDAEMKVFPAFNSLQMLAHRMCLPYHDMNAVSLTGRPWQQFDEALIEGRPLLGVLTDRHKTPQAIAQRMAEYGYDNYSITIGECLGNEKEESLFAYADASHLAQEERAFAIPNCMILQKTRNRERPFGIPETEFHLLNGRAKMITKMPVRLLTLSMLDLRDKHSFWDVGFCTGSVSIEAKLQFPHLHITAFEVREEGKALMEANSKKFGTPGIDAVIGNFLDTDISNIERPDAVFIGGHGGKLREIIEKLHSVMLPGATLVFNSVSEESKLMFEESIRSVGMEMKRETRIAIDEHNPIYIMLAR
ncbi:MAG: precorrin-6y C5,15-methyltransferase (decarboxylating) subunit CbiE [Prevotellaceae bacterium]|nr:precorrin-6y C5,15-methyltransferase (decarboxylating) subunit CbiE [Candidatus Minthosoma caballi]